MTSISSEKLRQYVTELEALEERKAELGEELRQVMAHAKGDGIDTKVLRRVIQLRRMKPEEASEQEELLSLYLDALNH